MVHHMVLYSCQHDFDEKHLNVTGRCYHPNMPRSVQECAGNSAVFAWAVGGVVRESYVIDILSIFWYETKCLGETASIVIPVFHVIVTNLTVGMTILRNVLLVALRHVRIIDFFIHMEEFSSR